MKKSNKFNYWLIPTVFCGIIAIASIIIYAISLNMALVLLILAAIGGTGFGLYRVVNFGDSRFEGMSEAGPTIGPVNALCIYARVENGVTMAEKVEFEDVVEKKRLGDRWYFEDLKRWLYVIYNDPKAESETWRAFELPDAEYTDPARMAIQLNMGRVNELFQLDPSLFDQLKPWILVAVLSIVGFLIFLSGS